MASTFSPTLRIELIGDGDQSGIWGQTTNTNLGSLIEQAITGVQSITMVDANYTLTSFNGVVDEARNAVLVVGGTNAAVRDVIAPLVEKLYVVKNSTVGGYAINIRAATGSSVSVPNGATVWVYCDGTNFNAINTESVGNFEVNGNLTVTGNTNAVAATYTGNVAASNFIGAGLTLTSINASNISAGTIANARTTAASANGASTIVARDANGSFSANVGTFVTVSGAHSGNGAGLTDINASNISTGTISNARTTAASANGASTIVARDSNGGFIANAITTTSISGNGVALTAINASNIASGTIANARTTGSDANGASTIVLRDANGSFAANVITATSGSFTNVSGNGAAISAINASNISSGTIANARTTASSANGASTIVARDSNGSFAGNVVTATSGSFTSVSGNGVALTAINASNISSGTLASARVSGSYTGITGVGTLTSGTWNATTIAVANGGTGVTTSTGTGSVVLSAGPTFTGTPIAPTAANGTNTTQIATTAFVNAAVTIATGSLGTMSTQNANNVSITGGSITGITDLAVADGGTGASTFSANNVLLGNGSSSFQTVAPGTSGNLLTSNGTTWASSAPNYVGDRATVFTSSGTFTIPAGITALKVTVVGGGGAGGGKNEDSSGVGGGGGAGFGCSFLTGLTPGATIAVTVGGGGVCPSNTSNGNSGGTSQISSGTQTVTTITATGGAGGGNTSGTVAAGGTSSGATFNNRGYPGNAGQAGNNTAGNGGISYTWDYGLGNIGGGAGGSAGLGGSGGGGGAGNFGVAGIGGSGGGGVVIFEY